MPSCPSCRAQYKGSDLFCRKCGARLEQPQAAENKTDGETPVIVIDVGLAHLYEQIEELRRVAPTLEIRMIAIPFNPTNPTEVEQAVSVWESQIDSKFAPYRDNPFIESLGVEAKKALHDWVSARVEEARRKLPALESHTSIE